MPIKQPNDLSSRQYVTLSGQNMDNGTLCGITIRIADIPDQKTRLNGTETLDDLKKLGVLKGADSLTDRASASQIKIAVGTNVWTVLESDASEPGWGPFLYDIGMELATLAGAGLRSHDTKVSEAALRVWQFYFTHRPDIIKRQLPQELKPELSAEPLQYMYQKSPDLISQELIRIKKWRSLI